MNPDPEVRDAALDAVALVEALLRDDWEGFVTILRATKTPRAVAGALATIAAEEIKRTHGEDAGRVLDGWRRWTLSEGG